MMNKIILSAFIFITLVQCGFAEDLSPEFSPSSDSGSFAESSPSPAFNGLYLGGGLNYINEKFKSNASYNVGGITGTTNISESLCGVGLKFFGGYGLIVFRGLYLGGELGLGIDRIFGGNKDKILESSNKLNYSIAARLGYVISNIMPYVKFGYEGRPPMKVFNTFNIRRNGYIFGGGVDISILMSVFLRAEYVHGFGSRGNSAGQGTFLVVPVSAQARTKTSSDTFLIGVGYKF